MSICGYTKYNLLNLLHSQKKPVAIATDFARVCNGVSSTGNKNGIPSKPIAKNVLNTLNRKISADESMIIIHGQ